MYIEAYGNSYRGFKFIALRFKKPIVKIRFKNDIQPIQTDNILVVYSNTTVTTNFNTLTFVVQSDCTTNAIRVNSGSESDLLLAMLNREHVFMHSFNDSVLYVIGSNKLVLPYDVLPKTITFHALYNLSKNGLENTLELEHFKFCKYFTRNHPQWKKWYSWWSLIQHILNTNKLISAPISIQMAKHISTIYKRSQQDFKIAYSDLYKCEIDFSEKPFLGIIFKMENNKVCYVSPMIVSKSNSDKPFHDVNQVVCNRWIPLYFNKYTWLNEGMYFYIFNLKENLKYLKGVLTYLEGTTIEKFSFIFKDLHIVYDILRF